jgi:hypothetical protein
MGLHIKELSVHQRIEALEVRWLYQDAQLVKC